MRREERRAEQRALVATYKESGLSQRAFAARHGISWHTFHNWVGRYDRDVDGPHTKPLTQRDFKFVEVRTASPSSLSSERWVCHLEVRGMKVSLSQVPSPSWLLEVAKG